MCVQTKSVSSSRAVSRTLKVEQTDLSVTMYLSRTSVLVCWQNLTYGLLMTDTLIIAGMSTLAGLVVLFLILIRSWSWLLKKQLFTRYGMLLFEIYFNAKGDAKWCVLRKNVWSVCVCVCVCFMLNFFRLCNITVSISHFTARSLFFHTNCRVKIYRINSDNIYYLIAL